MRIVVLVKQIPDTESQTEIDLDGISIRTDDIRWVMNPYDEIAVEEALRIKEQHGGKVTILSMGSQKASETIRTAIAMGADEGILIHDPLFDGGDALCTVKILTAALKQTGYDLIIAGQRSVDFDNCQIGPGVAELLQIPFIGMVVKQEITDGKIKCDRLIDGGEVVLEADLPILFTTQRGLNEPRYTSLTGVMKAKKKQIEVKSFSDLDVDETMVGAKNAKVAINSLNLPADKRNLKIIDGQTIEDQAASLVNIMHSDMGVF